MHLFTILAFAVLFWRSESPDQWRLLSADNVFGTLLFVTSQPLLLAVAGMWTAKRVRNLHVKHPHAPQISQQFHHRAVFILRMVLVVGFAASVLLTRWPDWFDFGRITPALQIIGDLIVISPYFVGALVLWIAAYPVERTLRFFGDPRFDDRAPPGAAGWPPTPIGGWRLGAYLDFNLRHHLLVVAAPITLILFAANMTRGHGAWLRQWSGWVWTPDVILALVAGGVFVIAPVLLCRIWRTAPLEPGPLRERLDAACRRIGLRCRNILIWKSDGIMINAAVMGVFAPVRYVLLSDALLETMNPRQIEAVFGHEAGHVRHRHIQHFLIFAVVGWLAVAGLMEGLAQASSGPGSWFGLSSVTIQGVGLAATVLFWGLGFGWVSRRFERQADLFGARCVTPSNAECDRPCSVHLDCVPINPLSPMGGEGGARHPRESTRHPRESGDPVVHSPTGGSDESTEGHTSRPRREGPGGAEGGARHPRESGTRHPRESGTRHPRESGTRHPRESGDPVVHSSTGGSGESTGSQTTRPGPGGPGPSDLGEPMIYSMCATALRAVGGPDNQTPRTDDGRICATAAAVFASALQRVAILNGIPLEERSWRHSSIGSRIRFLTSLAGDPARATAFERLIRRMKTTLFAAAVLGGAFFLYYWSVVPQPALLQIQVGVR